MWIGWIEFDVLLGDVHSLKEKRSVVRPVLAELKRRFDVSVAEAGLHDQYRRTVIGVGLVAADRAHLSRCLPPSNASWRPGRNWNCSAPASANSAATTEPPSIAP